MTDPGNSFFDPEPSCSYTVPKNNEQTTNASEIINTRRYRPAPASKKRKREEEPDNELLSICKPLSIKLHRLSQQAVSKVQKKSDQASRTKRRHRWRNGLPGKSKKKSRADKSDRLEAHRKSEKSEESEKHDKSEKSEMPDKSEKSESSKNPENSKNSEKSSESNQISDSSLMIPTHSWGCCRMIPFERNRSRSLRKLSLSRNRDSLEAAKDSESAVPRISLRERASDTAARNSLHSSSIRPLPVKERCTTKEEFEGEDEFVCRRTLPYIRKAKLKPNLQINSPEASNSRVSAPAAPQNEERKEKPRSSESEKFSSSKTFKTRRSRDQEEMKRTSIDTEIPSSAESKVFEKTDEAKVAENAKENDDENMEDFAWNSSNMWKYKRKHRSRRISSSSEEEGPRKKTKIANGTSERRPGPSSKRKSVEATRTLCPPSCTKAHHGTAFHFLYEKPKLKEGRVLLEKLEEMQSEEVVRWRNRLIKLEREVEEPEEEVVEEEEEDEYYLMYEDGTLSNEVLSHDDIYQMQGITEFEVNSQETNNPYQMNNLDVYFNVGSQDSSQLNADDDELDDVLRDDDDIPLEFSEYPKILLIRLETLVGSLETEYSASEIENLEEKYIDFMMNSNFSYDKQSQSFFQVYKRLHARRAKERELDSSDFSELDDSETEMETERDDYVDEKPLVIALDAEKDLASDDSLHDHEIATIRILPNDTTSHESNDESEVAPEFVSCERNAEAEKTERFYITCKFCKVSFKNLHSFSLHKTDCYTKNKKPMKCDYCDNQYKCRRTLKLHMQHIHGKGTAELALEKQRDEIEEKVMEKMGEKQANDKSLGARKKLRPAAQLNLVCGVCSVEFESKESLWDHILKHTEQELQDAYKDATKNNRNQELQEKLRRYDEKKKERESEKCGSEPRSSSEGKKKCGSESKSEVGKKDPRKSAFKYAQWKDRILYKMNINEKNSSTSVEKATDKESVETNHEEIVLSSSESESNNGGEIVDNSSTSRSSVIRNNTKTATPTSTSSPSKIVTMCPCHRNDTSTMVNGDMQIEMVLLCKICQVLFRRLDCFEVHYRLNKLCSLDRSSRSPKLFCSSCRIILNSLPEMRNHLEKHAKVNRQGHVTFLCNICKVMFFGVGSLFYSHWFNHNKDVNFLASRYSFPKLSIVQIVSTSLKGGQNQKEEYLFVAEYVCKNCKIPFGSESDLEKHACSKPAVEEPVAVVAEPKEKNNPGQSKRSLVVRVSCMTCKEVFPNREAYNRHEKVFNHLNSTKPEYICVSSNNSEKAYICTQCKTVRMSIEDLKEHWFFHRPWREKFSCANCPDVRSSRFEEIETHCKRCNKNVVGVCLVSLVAATYQCKPCNLHFETGVEWKEHRQMCKPPTVYKAYAYNAQSGYEPIMPGTPPPAQPTPPPPSPRSSSLVSSTVVSTVASAIASSLQPLSGIVKPSRATVTATPASAPTVLPITRSVPKSNFIAILPKPTPTPIKPKLTSATLLEKYLQLGTAPKPKPKSKKRQSEDVEVIEILSESSSRSSVTEFSRDTSSVTEVVRKETPAAAVVLNSNQASSPFDSFTTSNNAQSEYQRKDVSMSKAVVCYPSKRKEKKQSPRKDTTPQIPANQETSDDAERNMAMTAVNPEFETLLSELEGLETDPLKNILRMVRKKTKENLETSLLNSPGTAGKSTPRVSVEEVQVEDAPVSEVSSKCPEKDTLSPLPFEVVLLPEEAPSPKSGPVSQTSTASKISNSQAQDQSVTDKNINSEISKGTTEPGSSIIEEYIEYIMMDETAPPAVEVPKVEKAPTRLRVRSLAELQEIKMHLCDTCGESFNAKQSFDDHARENNCARARDLEPPPPPPPPQYVEPHREPVEEPLRREQSQDSASDVDYEAALRLNLVRRGVLAPNEFVPPLVPFTMQQQNASTSKAVMAPVSANLVVPEKRKSLPSSKSHYSNNTGVISPSSSTSRFNLSHAPRSGAIQLPERTGGSVIQKRPSGAATRIQNLNHRSEIHHRGLPQTYNRRNSLGIRPPPPYPSNESTRSPLDNRSPISSLSCTTCSFTAKNLSEFSNHLVMHYMETDQNRVNEDLNQESLNSLNSPNTSGFISGTAGTHLASAITSGPHPDIQSIAASDVYSGRSTAVTGNWQTPARYIYACQLCDFRTESKASIRLHEKNHSTVAVMRQKNLQRLQNQQMITQAFQTQRQQHSQQMTTTTASSLSQLMDASHGNSQQPIIPEAASAEQNAADLYNRNGWWNSS
ncbi:uncharacterized protein LOC117177722 isoform X2 [Belonocnema kinseyi]|uniref:uncharacterized protein LOC117177722 isoform X2 n=1 Tax=Belonocnema kinseyi TaxID=2817044 RepID=UPI00143DDA31|nr:uncharacterized protein LOC117177722 isoform X2 [Belonocnema kinseyi]